MPFQFGALFFWCFSFPISQSLSGSPCVNKYPQCPFQSTCTNTMFQAGHPATLKSSGVNRRHWGRCSTRHWQAALLTLSTAPSILGRWTHSDRFNRLIQNPIWTPDVPRVTSSGGPSILQHHPQFELPPCHFTANIEMLPDGCCCATSSGEATSHAWRLCVGARLMCANTDEI